MRLRTFSLFPILCAGLLSHTAIAQSVNPKPVKELGAPRLIATQANPLAADTANPNWVEGKEVYNPSGVAIDNSQTTPGIWITDTRNNRVLGWRTAQVASGAPADVILGQANPYQTFTGGPGTSNSLGLNAPTGVAVDVLGNVYVADSNNNRVLRFPTPFATSLNQSSPVSPDLVIGQTGFATGGANQGGISASTLSLAASSTVPLFAGLAFDTAGSLYVADVNNNRVLVFPASVLKTQNNGPAANLVLGQVNYTANNATNSALSAGAFIHPSGVAFDLKGRLYVGDGGGRVLAFIPPFVLGSNAARLVGIPTQIPGQPAPPSISNTTVGYPQGLAVAGGSRLVVVDSQDHRALVFDPYENWPDPNVTFSPVAYEIIGQTANGDHSPNKGAFLPTPATLSTPIGAAVSTTELFIADGANNRVLAYPLQAGLPAVGASRVIGQNFLTANSPNLIEGKEFNLVTSGGLIGSALIDRAATPPHLYVSDPGNNRILCFKDAAHVSAGDVADLIIGQPNGVTAVANYPVGDPTKPSATSLNTPTGISLDANGNLWVADSGNGRLLRFPAPFAQTGTGMPAANLVIGQSSFTSQSTNATITNMHTPVSVALTSDGSLLASDLAHNRVLFFQQPLSTGMPATKVIGQTDFITTTPNGTPSDPARFNGPVGIATDAQDRIYICDSGGARVSIYGSPSLLVATGPQPLFALTGFSQPLGISIGPNTAKVPGEVWVADAGLNAIVHFPAFTQLSRSSAPDSSIPVNTPLSIAYDAFSNLVVADGTSRVLFYAPPISVVNAANYLTRAVAPGTVVSIFPSPSTSTNVLGTTTANFTSLPNPVPLPTSLGDTQVLVNQQPTQLFYVSPTQINLPLSLSLPTSGTVDVRVVSKSTGQIYGATDLSMTAVSPGLFTLNSAGIGQLAALNEDNTVNGPGNPLTRGHVIQIFGTGQGAVSNAPADGMLDTGLAPTAAIPLVQINSISVPAANILYSGLAPGLIGVWQLNILVPTTVTAGASAQVVVTLNGSPSNDPSSTTRTTIALQ